MRRFFLLLLPIGLALFAARNASLQPSKRSEKVREWMCENGKTKVLSTTGIVGDIVGKVGRERIDNLSLISGCLDPHSYEIVKGDMEKLTYAEVIFSSGLGLEHGASLFYYLNECNKAVSLGDHIATKRSDEILIVDGERDPHVWMDVSLWAEIIDPICEKLTILDPEGEEYYKANAAEMKERLFALDQKVHEMMHRIPESKRYLITSHDAFNYFGRRYFSEYGEGESWQKRVMAPEGIAPDGNIGMMDIQEIIDHINTFKVHVIFPESNVSRDSLGKIADSCERLGIRVSFASDALYGDALAEDGEGADTYEKMIEHNAHMLLEQLEKEEM
jgi:manganese/zinc/iron transport system substrate-binding protein